jgi:hypothetical protein
MAHRCPLLAKGLLDRMEPLVTGALPSRLITVPLYRSTTIAVQGGVILQLLSKVGRHLSVGIER